MISLLFGRGVSFRYIMTMWVIVVLISLFVSYTKVNATHHDHNQYQLHNHQIHYSELDISYNPAPNEDFCTQVASGGGITETDLRNRVADALLVQPSRWDNTGSVGNGTYKVDFFQGAYSCFSAAYGDRSSIEVQYRTYSDQTDGKPCANGISCVTHYNAVSSVNNHYDYLNEVSWLELDHVNYGEYSRRQLISHETGHVLAYRDPTTCTNGPTIMNLPYYGCSDPGSGPTSHDKDVLVNDIIPNIHQ